MSEREQFLRQIDRLAASRALQGSESLCTLLRYLANHSLEHPGLSLKEYQIATEALGRPSDFDPQSDSTVRVQVSRLRSKFIEYYNSEGVGDPIKVELPKGHYALSFRNRICSEAQPVLPPAIAATACNEQLSQQRTGYHKRVIASVVLMIALIVCTLAFVLYANRNPVHAAPAHQGEATPPALQSFWSSFVGDPEAPWVIFGDAIPGADEENNCLIRAGVSPGIVLDHYVGEGQVLAVHDLDRVFGLMHRELVVKSARYLSLDDARDRNLILIGSPLENTLGIDAPITRQFVFQRTGKDASTCRSAIINMHPRAGEATEFSATATEDYALIALTRAVAPRKAQLTLRGTTTIGTQAAVELVCREGSIRTLLTTLSLWQEGKLEPFEAVFRVKIIGGVPLSTELVALRSDSGT